MVVWTWAGPILLADIRTYARSISELEGDICNIFPPRVFNAPAEVIPLELCNSSRVEKNYNAVPS